MRASNAVLQGACNPYISYGYSGFCAVYVLLVAYVDSVMQRSAKVNVRSCRIASGFYLIFLTLISRYFYIAF